DAGLEEVYQFAVHGQLRVLEIAYRDTLRPHELCRLEELLGPLVRIPRRGTSRHSAHVDLVAGPGGPDQHPPAPQLYVVWMGAYSENVHRGNCWQFYISLS